MRLAHLILARGSRLRTGPDDHGRAGARERRAEGAAGKRSTDLLEERRAVRLVQPVRERRREELGGARREPGAEDRGAAGGEGGVAVRNLGGKGGPRLEGVRPLFWDQGDRDGRDAFGDAGDPPVPGE